MYNIAQQTQYGACTEGDLKVSASQCPRSDIEKDQIKARSDAVGSLMYAQTCTRPDIAYVVGLLGRCQSDPDMEHWKLQSHERYAPQGANDHRIPIYWGWRFGLRAGCPDTGKSTSVKKPACRRRLFVVRRRCSCPVEPRMR